MNWEGKQGGRDLNFFAIRLNLIIFFRLYGSQNGHGKSTLAKALFWQQCIILFSKMASQEDQISKNKKIEGDMESFFHSFQRPRH